MSVERPPTSVYASASAVDQQLNCSVEMTTQRHLFFFFFQRHFTRKKKTTLSFRDGHNGATQCQVSPKSAIHSKFRKKENGVVQRVPVIFLSVSPRPNRFLCLFSARTWPHRRAPVPLHPLFVGLQHDGQSWAATAAVRCFSHSCFNYYFVGPARPFNKSFQPPPFVRFDLEPADWHII